jgi:hypothetical protein
MTVLPPDDIDLTVVDPSSCQVEKYKVRLTSVVRSLIAEMFAWTDLEGSSLADMRQAVS